MFAQVLDGICLGDAQQRLCRLLVHFIEQFLMRLQFLLHFLNVFFFQFQIDLCDILQGFRIVEKLDER